MIKFFKAIGAFLLTFVIILTLLMAGGCAETRYNTTAKIYKQVDNNLFLVDGAGYVWCVSNRPDLALNDMVTVYFDNNCTDYTREDDIILKIKKLDN